MSNFLTIATVTASLSRVLQTAVATNVPGATVTTSDPAGDAFPNPGVNVFLYQVTPSARLPADQQAHRPNGPAVVVPRTTLDLSYLVSFHGNDATLEPQRLLGSVARTLTAQPILTPDVIRQTIGAASFAFLAASDLADTMEPIRVTPAPMSLQDLASLWTLCARGPYALSLVYQTSVSVS